MTERVGRRDDEHLYQPRIHSRSIRRVYRIGQETGLPMTVLVDEALRAYCLTRELPWDDKGVEGEGPIALESSRAAPNCPAGRPSYRKTYEVVGWAYEADLHCEACTHERFGDELDDAEVADGEGNPIHSLFLGDATWDECCRDCGQPLTG